MGGGLDGNQNPLLSKQAIIVLREELEYFSINRSGALAKTDITTGVANEELREMKRQCGKALEGKRQIFTALQRTVNKENNLAEQHLIDMLCMRCVQLRESRHLFQPSLPPPSFSPLFPLLVPLALLLPPFHFLPLLPPTTPSHVALMHGAAASTATTSGAFAPVSLPGTSSPPWPSSSSKRVLSTLETPRPTPPPRDQWSIRNRWRQRRSCCCFGGSLR
jgi:hypothetical protein